MILKGEKTVEYREITQHYNDLFAWGKIKIEGVYYEADEVNICFHLRKGKNRHTMLVECEGLSIGVGNPNWGAVPNVPYFRLDLGKMLFVSDYRM